jgi:hypothetical protein
MTRKHFEAIAAAMRDLREKSDNTDSVDEASRALAAVCAESNGRFDNSRFLRACGV